MRPLLLAAVALTVALGSCSGEAAADCTGLADRWLVLHQEHLDRLAAAGGENEVNAADRWISAALLEQARDAEAVGCASHVASGAPAICARINGLVADGAAAQAALDALHASCRGTS